MEKYRNSGGNLGVVAFEINSDHILIRSPSNSRIYSYSYRKAGQHHMETMKKFALSDSGLNTYMNRYVKNLND